jgi:RES domain-containing protein
MRFRGILYRALNPIWASRPLSGEGAKLYGGRFNPRGTPAIYTSLSIHTALREANQVGSLQPTTLVSYQADLNPLFDARDETLLEKQGTSLTELAVATWREESANGALARTQLLASELIAAGYAGMIVPSFAAGASLQDLNLVIWKWDTTEPTLLVLIDDEDRLGRADLGRS